MKVAVLTITYRDDRFVRGCVKQFDDRFDHFFVVNETPWNGTGVKMDKTVEILEELGVDYIKVDQMSQEDGRNLGMKYLSHYDWVLIVDTDEEYSKGSLDRLYKFLETAKGEAYHASKMITFWYSKKYIIWPSEPVYATVAIKPHLRFTTRREVGIKKLPLPKDIVLRHYSYVRSNSEMKRKISNFSHASEVVPNWYEEKWLGWQKDGLIKDLHPTVPHLFKMAVKVNGL